MSQEQADRLWEEEGLKSHLRRMHRYLLQNGLMPMAVPDYAFLDTFYQRVLIPFFVQGVQEDEHGKRIV